MSLAKSFTQEQIATVQSWADKGDNLSEIQKKLSSEMNVRVTYMELRFLIDDLGVKLKEENPEPAKKKEEEVLLDDEMEEVDSLKGGLTGNAARVSISALQRPGAIICGTVEFAEGKVAEWWLDQMGQLGMNPKTAGFRPNKQQMVAFQTELRAAVEKKGF